MPSPTIILAILLALAVAGDGLLAKLYVSAREDVARVQQAFESFKAEEKALGEKAARETAAKEAADKLAKDTADAENKTAVAALNSRIAELRHQRDSSRSAFLSKAPAGSVCPQGQACFDRPEFERAYGDFVKSVRGLADEGTAMTMDLDTAKMWARRF